jgi:hypothetical protein
MQIGSLNQSVQTSLSSMKISVSLTLGVLLELSLCIVLVSSLSVHQDHVRPGRHTNELYQRHFKRSEPSLPTAMTIGALSSSAPQASNLQPSSPVVDVMTRENKMDDLFFENAPTRKRYNGGGGDDNDDENNRENNQHSKYNNLANYNTINLDNSIELEPDMLINNNHQSTPYEIPSSITTSVVSNAINASQNPRHYNSYQSANVLSSTQSNHHYSQYNNINTNINKPHYHHHHHQHQYEQNKHYGKYSPNMFANNYNLNYIHSFLSNKPSPMTSSSPSSPTQSSASSSSLLPYGSVNTNGLMASQYSSTSLQQPGGFVSGYMSVSSALSAAVNNLQQTIVQKQQQQQQPLSDANHQLQHLANSASSSSLSNNDSAGALPQSSTTTDGIDRNTNEIKGSQASSSAALMCGRQQVAYREPRVVGGNSTYEGEFPWAVSIQRHNNHHCGGVIVGSRWILTAAHCVRSQLVGNLAVRTGGHTLTRSSNGINSHLERDYQVDKIVMHDDFSRYDNLTASQMKSSANTNNADIALLKLKQDIHWNDFAWPVCFPDRDSGNFSGHDAIVIGWGKLNEKSEEFSNELQKVKLTIIDNKVCQNWFKQAGRDMPIDDRIICAGFKNGGKDACHGDSGGPLLSRINGQYVVVGVVSTGIGCARPLLPGLYSRVSSYIQWIEQYVTT